MAGACTRRVPLLLRHVPLVSAPLRAVHPGAERLLWRPWLQAPRPKRHSQRRVARVDPPLGQRAATSLTVRDATPPPHHDPTLARHGRARGVVHRASVARWSLPRSIRTWRRMISTVDGARRSIRALLCSNIKPDDAWHYRGQTGGKALHVRRRGRDTEEAFDTEPALFARPTLILHPAMRGSSGFQRAVRVREMLELCLPSQFANKACAWLLPEIARCRLS